MAPDTVRRGDLVIEQRWAEPLAAAGLDDLDALLAVAGDRALPKPGLAPWRERIALTVDGRTLFLKRYRNPPLSEQLRLRLRGHRAVAAAEWHWMHALPALGVPVPAPVAFGRRGGWRETASVVVSAAVPGDALERWLPAHLEHLRDRALRARLREALADLVATLHGADLVHRDLYLSHVFADVGDDGAVRLHLIDLQRVFRPRSWRRRRWIVKDLAALHHSTPSAVAGAAERLRWFHRYRGTRRLTPADKRLLRAVVARASRVSRRDRKQGRV